MVLSKFTVNLSGRKLPKMQKTQKKHTRISKKGVPFQAGQKVGNNLYKQPTEEAKPKVSPEVMKILDEFAIASNRASIENPSVDDLIEFLENEYQGGTDIHPATKNQAIDEFERTHKDEEETPDAIDEAKRFKEGQTEDFAKAEKKKPYGHKQYSRTTPTGKVANVPAKGVKPPKQKPTGKINGFQPGDTVGIDESIGGGTGNVVEKMVLLTLLRQVEQK